MTDEDASGKPAVGYKRPPHHTRFRPGQSGNPRGRQKGARNLGTDVKRTLAAPVALNDKGKTKHVSTQEAMLLRLKEKALKGDTRALDQFMRLAQIFNHNGQPDVLGGQEMMAEDQAILAAYAEALRSQGSGASDIDRIPDDDQASDANG